MYYHTNDLLKFIQKDTEAAGKVNTFHFLVSVTIGGTVAVVLSLFGITPSLVVARAGSAMLMIFLLAAAFLFFVAMVQSKRLSRLFFAISALAVSFTVVELLFVKLVCRRLKSSAIHFENLSHFDK